MAVRITPRMRAGPARPRAGSAPVLGVAGQDRRHGADDVRLLERAERGRAAVDQRLLVGDRGPRSAASPRASSTASAAAGARRGRGRPRDRQPERLQLGGQRPCALGVLVGQRRREPAEPGRRGRRTPRPARRAISPVSASPSSAPRAAAGAARAQGERGGARQQRRGAGSAQPSRPSGKAVGIELPPTERRAATSRCRGGVGHQLGQQRAGGERAHEPDRVHVGAQRGPLERQRRPPAARRPAPRAPARRPRAPASRSRRTCSRSRAASSRADPPAGALVGVGERQRGGQRRREQLGVGRRLLRGAAARERPAPPPRRRRAGRAGCVPTTRRWSPGSRSPPRAACRCPRRGTSSRRRRR